MSSWTEPGGTISGVGARASQILLDILVATHVSQDAVDLTITSSELAELTMTTHYRDDGSAERVVLDVTPLIEGAVKIADTLLASYARHYHLDPLDIIADIREVLEEAREPEPG